MGFTRLVCHAAPLITLALMAPANAQGRPWGKYQAAIEYYPISTVTSAMIAEECSRHQPDKLDVCASYILGVADELSVNRKFCLSSNSWTAQVVAVAVKYMRDHPEQWNRAPSTLIERALSGPFPCGPKK